MKKSQVLNVSFLIYLVSATAFASAATGTPNQDNSEKATSQIDIENSTQHSQQWQNPNPAIAQPQVRVANLEDFDSRNTSSQTDISTSQNTENNTQPNKIISVDQLSNFNPESEIPTNKENEYSDPLGQITSVEQLSDVQPTDWAFQALQSLVERYGCIAGYPDGSFRGNRAITRYEFAAGLNACLERIQQLIAVQTADLITQEDLAVLERLQENFAIELADIKGRVDALEARADVLAGQQFSTTTKLSGQIVM
ncbi:MAG: iron uptake porin, partial [Microcoleaceae cyanobacterium]